MCAHASVNIQLDMCSTNRRAVRNDVKQNPSSPFVYLQWGKFTDDREGFSQCRKDRMVTCLTGWLISMTIYISPFMDELLHDWTFWDELREARPNYDVGQDRQNVIHTPTETGNTISHMTRLNTLHTAWLVTWYSHDQSDDRWTFTWYGYSTSKL